MIDLIERLRKVRCDTPETISEAIKHITKLEVVHDAAKEYIRSLSHGKTAEAMNCRLEGLAEALQEVE